MEIIYSEGSKYSAICPECKSEILFKINTDNFNISGKCKKDILLLNHLKILKIVVYQVNFIIT